MLVESPDTLYRLYYHSLGKQQIWLHIAQAHPHLHNHTLPVDLIAKLSVESSVRLIDHIVMNLLASAIEFLDCLIGLYSLVPRSLTDEIAPPTVHCYMFSKAVDPKADSVQKVEEQLGLLPAGSYNVSFVQYVAPSNRQIMSIKW